MGALEAEKKQNKKKIIGISCQFISINMENQKIIQVNSDQPSGEGGQW